MTSDPDAKFDLDQLVARWSAKPGAAAAPAASATGVTRATGAIAAPTPEDPAALLKALRRSVRDGFNDREELAIALLMVDYELGMVGNVPLDAVGIGDLVGAMFPPEGSPPSPKLLLKYRERMVELLDKLEDLLDGLLIAAEARAPAA